MEYLFTWENWIYAGLILLILEIFTPGFVIACIGIGALLASSVAYFDLSISIQLIVFSIGTLLSFLGIRPYVLKHIYNSKEETITNAETLIGKVTKVKEAINNDANKGRISIYGDNWRARSEDGSIINKGETVEVTKIDSTVLIVKLK
ncbi:MAG: NfeD family protein [Chlamydiia bacterium]|nr:NfeD family protein [Chlamydiia bacterium]